jgi:hypothetical protein
MASMNYKCISIIVGKNLFFEVEDSNGNACHNKIH